MKLIAALSVLVLSASTLAANASPVQPFGSGTTLLVDGAVVDTANLNLISNGFTLNDHGSLLTVTYVQTPQIGIVPATGLLNVTDICTNISIGIGGINIGSPCPALSLSFTDANFGAVNLGVAVGLGVSESVNANLATLNIAQNGTLGLQSGTFAFVNPVSTPPSTSPVPEPGTLGMMATGLIGAAGAIRRRLNS